VVLFVVAVASYSAVLVELVVANHFAHPWRVAMDLCWAHQDLASQKNRSVVDPVFRGPSSVEMGLFLVYHHLVVAQQEFLGDFSGNSAVLSHLPMLVVHLDYRKRRRVLKLKGLAGLSYRIVRRGGVQHPPSRRHSLLQPKDYSTSLYVRLY
jgi:hypothetical protein